MFQQLDLENKEMANKVKDAYNQILKGSDSIELECIKMKDIGAYVIAEGLLNSKNIKYLYLRIIYF